tara:strand:- start:506 stop:796 length:291 start_codon:yes stop_codon:yes gene_type:complete
MVVLSSAIIILNNSKVLDNFKNMESRGTLIKNNVFILIYISLLLLVTALPAVLVAVNCNKENKLMYGLLAFLFSDIYLLQWAIKKFILNIPGYCKL